VRKHLTDGELRTALDGELEPTRRQHLDACTACQARAQQLQVESQRTAGRLSFLASADESVPAAQGAWDRFAQQVVMKKETSMFKKLFAFPVVRFGTAALLILTLVLAFPGTRALAGELLNLFRVQQVTVVPVDFTGLQQLAGEGALNNRFTELLSSSVEVTDEPGDPTLAADAAEAGQLAGFNVRLPQDTSPTQIYVTDGGAFTMTVDRAKAQMLLEEAGRSDLVLPESIDGAEISVEIPSAVSAAYGECPEPEREPENPHRYYHDCVMLVQVPSPSVNAPADVDVKQLAQIGLEFTGMSPEEAAAFTSTVDWTSTLVVPIPRNAAVHEQVSVDGVTGTLIQRSGGENSNYALLWVRDGIIYVVRGTGANSQQAIDLANSLP
jgi:hypothetical protein